MSWGITRLVALALLVLTVYFVYLQDFILWESIYMAVLTGHYILAFLFIRKPIANYILTFTGFLTVTAVVGVSHLMFEQVWGIILFLFAIHFGLSEAYSKRVVDASVLPANSKDGQKFVVSHITLNTLIYLSASWHNLDYFGHEYEHIASEFYFWIVAALTVAALLAYLCLYFFNHEKLFGTKINRTSVINYILPEIGYFALIPVFRLNDIGYSAGIFYHLLFWIIAPALARYSRSKQIPFNYLATTFVLTGLIFLGTPYAKVHFFSEPTATGFALVSNSRLVWEKNLVYFGILHINLSFLFSNLNPAWLNRINNNILHSAKIFTRA